MKSSADETLIPRMSLKAPTQSVTTSRKLNISQTTTRDDQSHIPVSQYVPSICASGKEIVDFLPAPKRPPGEKYFECPYWFTLCPKPLLDVKAWRWLSPETGIPWYQASLMRDIEPTLYMTYALTYVHTKTTEIWISCITVAKNWSSTKIICIEEYFAA
jgi:hypothetical protein